jgi:hypothetical protein
MKHVSLKKNVNYEKSAHDIRPKKDVLIGGGRILHDSEIIQHYRL